MAEAPPETPEGTHIAFVGTYTRGDSEGIYAYRYNSADGGMVPLGLVAETPNPSFLGLHPNGKFLYAVNEGDPDSPSEGSISAFAIDAATGDLTFLNKVDSMGGAPCHVVVDQTGNFVFVANYHGGSVINSHRQGVYRLNDHRGGFVLNDHRVGFVLNDRRVGLGLNGLLGAVTTGA